MSRHKNGLEPKKKKEKTTKAKMLKYALVRNNLLPVTCHTNTYKSFFYFFFFFSCVEYASSLSLALHILFMPYARLLGFSFLPFFFFCALREATCAQHNRQHINNFNTIMVFNRRNDSR